MLNSTPEYLDPEPLLAQFEERYRQRNLTDCTKPFIKDGIVNPALYARQPVKVLFMAKEHNYRPQHDYKNNHADYRKWMSEVVLYQFAHRLAEWAYGIQHGFPEGIEQLSKDQKKEALKSIAFINVKKASGTAQANAYVIGDYIRESQDLLHQQIHQIAPTLIVGCFQYDWYLEQLFGVTLQRSDSHAYSHGRWNNIPLITVSHPSSRKPKRWLYAQLKEAVEQATRQP